MHVCVSYGNTVNQHFDTYVKRCVNKQISLCVRTIITMLVSRFEKRDRDGWICHVCNQSRPKEVP